MVHMTVGNGYVILGGRIGGSTFRFNIIRLNFDLQFIKQCYRSNPGSLNMNFQRQRLLLVQYPPLLSETNHFFHSTFFRHCETSPPHHAHPSQLLSYHVLPLVPRHTFHKMSTSAPLRFDIKRCSGPPPPPEGAPRPCRFPW